MFRVMIACVRSEPTFSRPPCPTLESDLLAPADVDAWARAALREGGWTAADGEYFCPGHNPADIGDQFDVTANYQELAPGLKVRLFGRGFPVTLEVRRETVS